LARLLPRQIPLSSPALRAGVRIFRCFVVMPLVV
jgi:hypothetical protein